MFVSIRSWYTIQFGCIVHPMSAVEIICKSCGEDTLLNREVVYDGFTKSGEKLTCSSCGHEYASEAEVPFKSRKVSPQIFTEADRPAKIEIFGEGENKNLCRYCANYVVNPFTQFCSARKKEVQSTDTCEKFDPAPEKDLPEGAPI